MVKRQLTDEERKVSLNVLEKMQDEIKWIEFEIINLNLHLNKGIDFKFRADRRELKDKYEMLKESYTKGNMKQDDALDVDYEIEFCELMLNGGFDLKIKREKQITKAEIGRIQKDLDDLKSRIDILKDQMENGVEVKENVEEKESRE